MKVLFYQRGGVKDPIGLFYLFAMLQNKHEITYCGTEYDLKKALFLQPDVLMLSVYSGDAEYFKELAYLVKKEYPRIKIVAGGPHPTFYPRYIKECTTLDAICLGEGEEPALRFLDMLEKKDTSYLSAPNFHVRAGEEIVMNRLEPRIVDLDILPMPERSYIYDRYPAFAKMPKKYFLFGRGCPFNCTYCFNHKTHEMYAEIEKNSRRVRQRSVHLAIDEILQIKSRYGIKVVRILDDVLTFNKKWLKEFIPIYKKEVDLPFICHYRLNMLDQEVVQLLKEGSCIIVNVAIESGDLHMRNQILKRNMSDETIFRGIRLLKGSGIKVWCENIVGLPGETSEQALKTLKMNIDNNIDHAYCSLLQPYPGLKITEYAIREGYFDNNYEKLANNYYQYSLLCFKDAATKRFLENLANFFSFCVEFPRLRFILLPIAKYFPHCKFLSRIYIAANSIYYEEKIRGFTFSAGKGILVIRTIFRIFWMAPGVVAKKFVKFVMKRVLQTNVVILK